MDFSYYTRIIGLKKNPDIYFVPRIFIRKILFKFEINDKSLFLENDSEPSSSNNLF